MSDEQMRLAAEDLKAAGPIAVENCKASTLAALDTMAGDWDRLRRLYRKAFRATVKQCLASRPVPGHQARRPGGRGVTEDASLTLQAAGILAVAAVAMAAVVAAFLCYA